MAKAVNMSEEEMEIWARDLGCYYSVKGLHPKAIEFFERVFEINVSKGLPKNSFVQYRHSQSKRALALPEQALVSSQAALAAKETSVERGLEVMSCLYEMNRLEAAFAHGCNYQKLHVGHNAKAFQHLLDALSMNFEDSCGEPYLGFLCLNKEAVFESHRLYLLSKIIDERPLWKILKAQGNCDVLSILEKEEVLLCPREAARRARGQAVFNQYYLGLGAKDIDFVKSCLHNPSLLLSYSKEITPLLEKILSKLKHDVHIYLGMLHCRNPLYNVNYHKFSRPGQAYAYSQLVLNQAQILTRRAMHNILNTIRTLRNNNNLKKLEEFVELTMGDFISRKTLRVMPMKFEFFNEVYNHLALAYLKVFEAPMTAVLNGHGKKRLFDLFRITEDETKVVVKQFGDKTSYIEQIKSEEANVTYRAYLQRMEKRLFCAKYPIEKAYIYYHIAKKHLGLRYYDMCKIAASRGLKEARRCNSLVWQMLNLTAMAKTDIFLQKYEILKEHFTTLNELSCQLKNVNFCSFFSLCLQIVNEEMMAIKAKKIEPMRSTFSLSSRH